MKTILTTLSYVSYCVLFATILFFTPFSINAQTEDFEGETLGGTSFVVDNAAFQSTGDLEIHEFTNFSCGGTNTAIQEIWILDEIVGIEDLEVLQIEVYPNPTAGIIEIQGIAADQIDLIDIHGKLLSIEKLSNNKVDISTLPIGIYFLKLTVDDQIVTKRIIKI